MIVCIESLAVLGAPSPEIKRMIELRFRGVAGARFSCAATARVADSSAAGAGCNASGKTLESSGKNADAAAVLLLLYSVSVDVVLSFLNAARCALTPLLLNSAP